MNAEQLITLLTQIIFLLIFPVVALRAIREPRKANVDTALWFGVAAYLQVQGWALQLLRLPTNHILSALSGSLLMALPYLLVRLVDDFSGVPRRIMRFAEVGLAGSVLALFALTSPPTWLVLIMVAYFVVVTVYVTVEFVRAAAHSSGVTRRRMQAVAAGSLAIALALFVAGALLTTPHLANLAQTVYSLCALAAGLFYLVGFAPPRWLRRTWQEPEVRAFLGRAGHLPRLPDTQSILRELEDGAAMSLGATAANIGLWDEGDQVLRYHARDQVVEQRPVRGSAISADAFLTQRSLFSENVPRDYPDHAAAYRSYGAQAMLAAPISAGERRLGVLLVYAARAPIFAEDDLVLAQLLADQAAVILESRALIDEAARVRAREEITHLKDDFLSAAAHDLKTPLTALVMQAQLLEKRALRQPDAPADPKGLQRIVNEAERLRRLVMELLDVSRVEGGQLVGQREPMDLVEVVTEACARHTMSQPRPVLETAGPVHGLYDGNRIMQLVDNLLENAIKYSPQSTEVLVKVWQDGESAHLTVTDFGIGIPATDLPHLFDRFHRGANVDDRRFAGMGLGLYICRGIVEQHGGQIAASSPGPGQGSTFHVVLPAADTASALVEARPSAGDEALPGAVRLAGENV